MLQLLLFTFTIQHTSKLLVEMIEFHVAKNSLYHNYGLYGYIFITFVFQHPIVAAYRNFELLQGYFKRESFQLQAVIRATELRTAGK